MLYGHRVASPAGRWLNDVAGMDVYGLDWPRESDVRLGNEPESCAATADARHVLIRSRRAFRASRARFSGRRILLVFADFAPPMLVKFQRTVFPLFLCWSWNVATADDRSTRLRIFTSKLIQNLIRQLFPLHVSFRLPTRNDTQYPGNILYTLLLYFQPYCTLILVAFLRPPRSFDYKMLRDFNCHSQLNMVVDVFLAFFSFFEKQKYARDHKGCTRYADIRFYAHGSDCTISAS